VLLIETVRVLILTDYRIRDGWGDT
jgi:hypothetical protein